eukprot:scaffold31729_cov54-Phaeocystis_antarctica.AAC.1
MQTRLWVLSVASVQAALTCMHPPCMLTGNAPDSSAFEVLLLPPSPMPPEPSPPPPPQPQPPEPSPPPPSPSLPPDYGHDHPVQQHSFPVEMMPYQIAVEEPTLAVQVLVSMSSLTAMLFLSLVTWQVLVNRTMARRCGPVHASTHTPHTRARAAALPKRLGRHHSTHLGRRPWQAEPDCRGSAGPTGHWHHPGGTAARGGGRERADAWGCRLAATRVRRRRERGARRSARRGRAGNSSTGTPSRPAGTGGEGVRVAAWRGGGEAGVGAPNSIALRHAPFYASHTCVTCAATGTTRIK